MKRVPENFAYCSANVAFIRLKDVISADRSAVPCGRWVRAFEMYRGTRVYFDVNGKPVYRLRIRT